MILLVEHFYSIQGEGKYMGRPSVFFRFGGCNMKCEGFGCLETAKNGTKVLGCDTIYAVNREGFSHNWQSIKSANELLDILKSYSLPNAVDIVLTGGEPLIYANDDEFVLFLKELHKYGHKICFETNGSLDVNFEKHPIYRECEFALSVKLANSDEPLVKRVNETIIRSLTINSKDAFFKFSIGKESIDSQLQEEIQNIVNFAPNTDVYCMPLGGSKKEVEENSEPLVEFCKLKGYNFSDRLHIRIWDKEKGV